MHYARMNAVVKVRPIPFKPAMSRAIWNGQKTQTRRIMKPQPLGAVTLAGHTWVPCPSRVQADEYEQASFRCPYGVAGERLWVREPWAVHKIYNQMPGSALPIPHPSVWYCADYDDSIPAPFGRYRHGRFMPQWASRMLLEVVAVRVQRLQNISEADARAEGVTNKNVELATLNLDSPLPDSSWVGGYRWLWESIHGEGSWAANPWIWVVDFKLLTRPVPGEGIRSGRDRTTSGAIGQP